MGKQDQQRLEKTGKTERKWKGGGGGIEVTGGGEIEEGLVS
jgi:hypothetical protein